MDADQRRIYHAIKSGPRGIVEGPLRVWLKSPELADRAQQLGTFCRYDTVLPPRLSELAIITTGAFWKAPFEWHIHAPIAIQEGISPDVVEAIRKDQTPQFENVDERITYEFCRSVWQNRQVSDDTYEHARDALGERGMSVVR